MNPELVHVRILPCEVCDYRMSDEHHVLPQRDAGGDGPIVALCPNHHRYANLLQLWVRNGASDEEIAGLAAALFDRAFTERALPRLVEVQRNTVELVEVYGPIRGFEQGGQFIAITSVLRVKDLATAREYYRRQARDDDEVAKPPTNTQRMQARRFLADYEEARRG